MKYTIKAGNKSGFTLKRFFPFRWSQFKRRRLEWEISIDTIYDPRGDNDLRYDWSKLLGVNLTAFKPSNVNSIMNAFRSTGEVYEQTLFRNSNGKQLYDNNILTLVRVGEKNKCSLEYIGKDKYRFMLNGKEFIFEEKNRSWLCRLIFPWHGGKDDDGNWLGGHAPEDIHFTINYRWVKK